MADAELAEREILARYLPKDLSEDELVALVDEVLTTENLSGPKAMGQAMKAVNTKVAGRADGRKVSELVKARLTKG